MFSNASFKAASFLPVSWSGLGSAGVTVIVSPVLIALSAGTVAVTCGAYEVVAPATLTLSIPTPTVYYGVKLTPASCDLYVDTVAPAVRGGTTVVGPPTLLYITSADSSVRTGALATSEPCDLILSSADATVRTGARTVSAPCELALYGELPYIVTGAIATVPSVDLVITVAIPKVYDKTGSITYSEVVDMRLNVPEILAFSTDITTDMLVVEAMEDDMSCMDGTQSVKLVRKTDNVVVDFVLGTAIPENKIYVFDHALIRQVSERDNRAVKQLRMFMQSVQNDEVTTLDTIIELPRRDDVQIKSGDHVVSDLQGTTYTVIAIDDCTLKTRWRLGARKIV